MNFFTNQVFLEKAWRASVGLQGVRHTVLANFYTPTPRCRRRRWWPPAAGDFAGELDVKQTGASAVVELAHHADTARST